MKIGQQVEFEFIGNKHKGKLIELYTCTSRKMMIVECNLDGTKYPIEIREDSSKIAKVGNYQKKKTTKKSRVLDLYESCKVEGLSEVRIPWAKVEESNFSHKDISYFKAVLKELKLKVIRESDSLRVIN